MRSGVGQEVVVRAFNEVLDRCHQTVIPRLNQIQNVNALVGRSFRDGHNQVQIRFQEPSAGGFRLPISGSEMLNTAMLFLAAQGRNLGNQVKIEPLGVINKL